MLDDASSKDDHTAFLCLQRAIIQKSNVLNKINDEALLAPRLEENDIAKGSIREGRAEDGDIVLPAPVVNAFLVVDTLTNAGNNLLRRENCPVILLLFVHFFHDGLEP